MWRPCHAVDDYNVAFELKIPNSRFHTTFLDRWGCTWIMPKHIFEGVEDPVTFEFDPFVGTGAYKLHSYDDAGFWTIWEKREDWDKSPTGILYGEPVATIYCAPKLRQRRRQDPGPTDPPVRRGKPLSRWAEGCTGAGRNLARLPAHLPLGGQQRPGHHRYHL